MTDAEFFAANPDRQAHIRTPEKVLAKNKQRAVRYLDEQELAFRSLGPHDVKQRYIIAYRIPADNPAYDPEKPQIIQIPMLAHVGELIPDNDDALLPIINELMLEASKSES